MRRKITSGQMNRWANRGNEVAFSEKRNANAYIKELKARGRGAEIIRSHGPTVEGKRTKSYYIVPTDKKGTRKVSTRQVVMRQNAPRVNSLLTPSLRF